MAIRAIRVEGDIEVFLRTIKKDFIHFYHIYGCYDCEHANRFELERGRTACMLSGEDLVIVGDYCYSRQPLSINREKKYLK